MKPCKDFLNRVLTTKEGTIVKGDFIVDNGELTVRCDNDGYLNDAINTDDNTVLPAIETADGSHIEHWNHGVLHYENGPAVIDNYDNYEQWWYNGVLIKTVSGANND